MDAAPLPKRNEELDDDGLGELPPLDGEGGDAEGTPSDPDEVDDGDDENAKNLLDDTTGEGDPVDAFEAEAAKDEALTAEGGWLDDATDAEELDVGSHELDDQELNNFLEDADEPGVGDEDFGLDGAGAALAGDAGEEGPEAADEALREEDLPRLDADADGELEDGVFADAWPTVGGDERPPWDDRAWERATWVPQIGLARGVVPLGAPDTALVAASSVLRVDAQGAAPLGGDSIHGSTVAGVALLSDGVVAATAHGLFVGDGPRLREVHGWGELGAGPIVEIAAHGTHIWVRTAGGALVESGDRGVTWLARAADGVDALTATPAGELVALRHGAVVRGTPMAPWGAALPTVPEAATPLVRARGRFVVVAVPGAGAFRSDGGPWERLEGTGSVTALTLLDDDGTTLVALHAAAEDRSWIARAGADGIARIVVEIGGEADEGDDPRVLDLAWSDASRLAWAVGPFGVAILRPR